MNLGGIFTALLIIMAALALPGLVNRTRSILSGRKGPRFVQHILSVRAMSSKGVITGHTSTIISTVAPSLYLASCFMALLMIPMGNLQPVLSFGSDVVMFAYLLALGRLGLILSALDTGSSFEGMGASRDALYGAMVEPALFIVAGTFFFVSGQTNFADMFGVLSGKSLSPEMIILMILFAFVVFRIICVECGRIPVDDPRTHLELTMIHEVMVLDYSGLDLAMVTVGGWIKTAALSAFGANILVSVTGGGALAAMGYTLLFGVFIGINESFFLRNKMARNTTFIFALVALAFVLFMVAYILSQNIRIE